MTRLFLKPAAAGKYNHSYSPVSILSLDLGDLNASEVIEVNPGDQFDIKAEGIMRVNPQKYPPFGKAFVKTAAFFVPEHELIEYSNALHERMTTYKGKAIKTPYFMSFDINSFFASSGVLSTLDSSVTVYSTTQPYADFPAMDSYDFCRPINAGSDQPKYEFYSLTPLGRKFYKTFKMLGYDWFSPTFQFAYSDIRPASDVKVNALPFLAYAKIYVDMFLSGVQYNASNLTNLLKCIHDNQDCVIAGQTYYNSSTGYVSSYALNLILFQVLLPHDQTMYTSAWNSPNSPDGVTPSIDNAMPSEVLSPYLDPSLTSYGAPDSLITTSVGNISVKTVSGYFSGLSQFGQNLLKAFDKFVVRWNLAGTKAAQRFYAQFGLRPGDFNTEYVHKLYEGSERLQFHPVMSNSQTGAPDYGNVGDYAGFCAAALNFSFNYKSSQYGYIIVLHWIQVSSLCIHGMDPSVLRYNGLDWYSPDYDGKALRAIPQCEVGMLKEKRTGSECAADPRGDISIYGFTNLYDDYRHLKDRVVGDMVDIASGFLFARNLSYFRSHTGMAFKPQASDIQYYDYFSNPDINEVFQSSRAGGDRFYLQFDYDISAERSVKSDSDSVDLNGTGDTEINKNGEMMS